MKVDVKGLNFDYGDKQVLSNITFKCEGNDVLIILGHNGAGKTTLIKCILNSLIAQDNTIYLDDIDINKFSNWTLIGYVPQDVDIFGFPITVTEFLISFSSGNHKNRVFEVLKEANIFHLKDRNINSLSGGERRRVYIARALLNNISVLILDEPTVAIDQQSIQGIVELIHQLSLKNILVIIITHNFNELQEIATHVMVLEKQIKFYGTKEEFMERSE